MHPERTARATTAVVYCEANFGASDGKTANGLVRYSEKYEILSVVDSTKAGLDAGEVLDGKANGIPICADLTAAIALAGHVPAYFIFGVAPTSGMLTPMERGLVLDAMSRGMSIVNGLHEFLNDDPEFAAAAEIHGVTIHDVRRPHEKKNLRVFSGRIAQVTCPRIAVLGTDAALGKRTTAVILTRALNARGIKTVMIGTGQTGLIQGARYGVALDAIPCQFCSGELEAAVVEAFEAEHPDVIVIEGQGALSHPAYLSSVFILRGSLPQAVILQHAPARPRPGTYADVPVPTPESEINLIETFADTTVIGLTINHECMTDADVTAAIERYESELGIPATYALTRAPSRLVDMVVSAFPELEEERAPLERSERLPSGWLERRRAVVATEPVVGLVVPGERQAAQRVFGPEEAQRIQSDVGKRKTLRMRQQPCPHIVRVQVLDGRDEAKKGAVCAEQLGVGLQAADERGPRNAREQRGPDRRSTRRARQVAGGIDREPPSRPSTPDSRS